MPKRGVGRPSELTKAVQRKYCDAISIGATHEMAASHAGIHYATSSLWRLKGQQELERRLNGEPPDDTQKNYVAFFEAVEAAKQERGLRWVQVVNDAANVDAGWAWRRLQNDWPDDFRPAIQRQEITGKDGGAIESRVHLPEIEAALQKVYGDNGDAAGDAAAPDDKGE